MLRNLPFGEKESDWCRSRKTMKSLIFAISGIIFGTAAYVMIGIALANVG